ncbi:alpha-1,6-mannosylglycoprotein 6-beta-N-acetylglucosaminyltransferase B-like [Poeciliopsis prolifica]|uniref:alpha-1,6-mannosylglycoprotein 6-beta-N-acetylglucosaminyltransferase B-like n=1 Tax=Poeciliopsis prolifica TaxID=188132 RepID=UPI0024142363|nr:alpha-1,6-mannosylglycoprotein 6-beta-N-acetylglucosaminyltransferase B-like [Poeciliopsis prolifica]
MRVALRPRSGCLVLCLCVSVVTLLLQGLWVPPERTRSETAAGKSPDEKSDDFRFHMLAVRLEALNAQVQKLSSKTDKTQTDRNDLSLLLHSFRQDQQGLARLVETELQKVSQRLDQLTLHHHHHHQASTPHSDIRPERSSTGLHGKCEVPTDPAYPACAEKVEFLRARWQSDPCYAFYGVNGSTCSILVYLSQVEDFCPPQPGQNHTAASWRHKTPSDTKQAFLQASLTPLYEVIGSSSSPAVKFIRSRVERMSESWIWAGREMKPYRSEKVSPQMKVLLYLGALAGDVAQRFEAMVDRGGPLGELVQWADLSACLTILGHNLTFSTSQHQLRRLIGAAPGQGSCPIQRPLTFDLIYTDYHGLAHLHRVMGLAFQHYQCRFRILDSFGTEPAFNLASYAHLHGFKTQWGSWGLQPLQYMTMFPHTPDNSFLGFVGEDAMKTKDDFKSEIYRKDNIAVVYGKQEHMWQGKSDYLEVISQELEIHATVFQPSGRASSLPSFVKNHGLLSQENFLQLLRRAKVFVGLGFPYEGPAPVEAVALGCMFLQPRFDPPHSSHNDGFYKGKPTTRQITSQHPYFERFVGKPFVWTVDMNNRTDIRDAVESILKTKVKPFAPPEFTCLGMLQRMRRYITHQNFCGNSTAAWDPEPVPKVLLGPLGQSCVDVCQRSALTCDPALFHRLNSPDMFTRLGLGCSSMVQEVNHLFPSYSPWGRLCGLQQEPLLFSCAGSDSSHRRLCPCRSQHE